MNAAHDLPPPEPMPPPTDPDPQLLADAVGGDRAAQGAVARLYYPRMRRWALLETRDPALAEDAVQDALVRWVRFAHTYRSSQPFTPWMRTLVRNSARDRLAKTPRRRGILALLPWNRPPSRARLPDHSLDLSRSARRVLDLLGQLTPRQRELVDLCDLQGLSAANAARQLGLKPGTARVHLHEGRKHLKTLLGGAVHDLVKTPVEDR